MIKATHNGTVILGLSDVNIERLKNGEPISINLKELGLSDTPIFIFNGRTEDSMKRELKNKIHPYLTTIVDKRVGNKN